MKAIVGKAGPPRLRIAHRLKPALLAQDITEAILYARQPVSRTAEVLMGKPILLAWMSNRRRALSPGPDRGVSKR